MLQHCEGYHYSQSGQKGDIGEYAHIASRHLLYRCSQLWSYDGTDTIC